MMIAAAVLLSIIQIPERKRSRTIRGINFVVESGVLYLTFRLLSIITFLETKHRSGKQVVP